MCASHRARCAVVRVSYRAEFKELPQDVTVQLSSMLRSAGTFGYSARLKNLMNDSKQSLTLMLKYEGMMPSAAPMKSKIISSFVTLLDPEPTNID